MPHQMKSLSIWQVYLRDMAYPKYFIFYFKKFSKSWNFIHKTSNLKFPQSNGFVEIAIQTIMETLRKCREDNNDPYLVMSVLRTTKNSSGTATSELLMKRKLWTLVPSLNVTVKHQNETQETNSQPIQRTLTIEYKWHVPLSPE